MQDRSHYELQNERNRGAVRTVLTIAIAAYLYWLLRAGTGPTILTEFTLSSLVGAAAIWNLGYWVYLLHVRGKQGKLHPSLKYSATLIDCLLVTTLLLFTGGTTSRLFLLYIIVVISAGMRYGMRPAIFTAFVFNITYGALVLYEAGLGRVIDGQTEVARVLGVWILALYIGYLSRRIEFLQNRVEQYRALVRQLTERGES